MWLPADACPAPPGDACGVSKGSEAVMQEWLQNQEWSAELWVAAWVAAVVLVNLVLWNYGNHVKR